jgi:hypothetical protein
VPLLPWVSELVPPAGEPGVLSGGIVELLMPPDLVPVASAPYSVAAKVLADAVASNPANNSEVILMFIRVRLHKMSRYLILV